MKEPNDSVSLPGRSGLVSSRETDRPRSRDFTASISSVKNATKSLLLEIERRERAAK